jgi:uncharacterized protein YjdB
MKKIAILLVFCFAALRSFSQLTVSLATGTPPTVPTGWLLANSATAAAGGYVQLTPPTGSLTGQVYYNTLTNLTTCGQFTVDFDFQIIPSASAFAVADGITFFFVNPLTSFVAGTGLGLPNPLTGFVFTIDPYDNDGDGLNPEIQMFGYSTSSTYAENDATHRLAPIIANQTWIQDGFWHHVKITYNAGNISVYLNGSGAPSSTGYFAITTAGYFGFTASTGGAYSTQNIKNVYINSNTISPIVGPSVVCTGPTTTYTDATVGGTWSSSNGSVASIDATTGVLTGVSAGTTNITYAYSSTCQTSITVTVNTTDITMTGVSSAICPGTPVTFTDATSGGTWSSSNTGIATVGTSSGAVTGVSNGAASISYTLPSGCSTSLVTTVTIGPPPISITPTAPSICDNASLLLTAVSSPASYNMVPMESWENGAPTTAGTPVDGWNYIGTTNYWTQSNGSTLTTPTIAGAAAGYYIARFKSRTLATGSTATLYSPSFSMVGATTAQLKFSVYRDVSAYNTATYDLEGINVYVNTSASLTGATSLGYVPRRGGLGITGPLTGTGVTATSGWQQYTVTIPATFIGTTNYILFNAVGKAGDDIYLDSILIQGTPAITWSPAANLYTDAAATIPYVSGTPTSSVYFHPASSVSSPTTVAYTASSSNGLCSSTTTSTVTINPTPAAITGSPMVCTGFTTTLSDATAGGSWSSGSSNATIDATTGVVTGMTVGTALISYSFGGCAATTVVTVNANPAGITGAATVCVGSTTSLADATSGGAWTSSNTTKATVNFITGVVTGVAAGTSVISYTIGAGCYSTTVVTVNANPLPIVYSTTSLCVGQTTTMTDPTTGGLWLASPVIVGSVGAATGVVKGISAGTVTISYRVLGCAATVVVTVVGAPAITSISPICQGTTATLSGTPTGGTWTSIAGTGSALVTSAGVITGGSAGTATISYGIGTGCTATQVVTVLPLPSLPTGVLTVCPGTTTTLSDATSGGTWSSSGVNASATTLTTTTGLVTGISAGTEIITYNASGCSATAIVTVNPNPSSILGAYSMCAGATTTFSDATVGGTWSSATSLITIGSSSGVATAGAVSGTNTISYTVTSTGCYATANITINPLPSVISGTLSVCPGLTTTLSDLTPGGIWSTSSSNFTVDISGVVTGGTPAGTGLVSYTDGVTGCVRTAVVTVSAPPAAIGGVASVCVGFTTTLTDATTGGTWSTSTSGVASIASSGIVTGVGVGTSTITYTVSSTGCFITKVVTVNAGPGTITGSSSVCVGQTITLTSSSGGGSWSSSNLAVGTIDPTTGILGGVTSGTITVTNSLGSGGCSSTTIVTVTPSPAAIGGTTSICVGACTTLTDASTGGTWSISPAGVATIISGTGLMCGSAAGTATVTYATGCPTTTVITVNALPGAITGTLSVCSGSATTVADATTGGTWSSSNSAVASIGSLTGIITGGSVSVATTATITYSMPTGCVKTAIVTVNPLPTSITSTPAGMQVCIGSTIALTGAPTGGTWLSSDITIATVGSTTGVVTGIAAPTTPGTVTITYTLPTGCTLASTVTVNPLPSVVSGTLTVCPGTTTTLSDPTSGGVWSSSLPTTASVGTSTGIVMGIAPGTATIAYTLTTGCRRTAIVTVNTVPGAITPASPTVCEGQTITLSDGTTGGNWSEADGTGTATVGASTGIVTGSTAGTVTISYTLSATGCFVTKIVTVLPNPAAIGGNLSTCAGSTGTLTDGTPSGSWISSSPGVVSINPSTGVYTAGTSAGTATVTYIMGSGCYTTTIVTVTTAPTNISGSLVVCEGSTTTLVSTPTGGTWSSSNSSVFTVDATGVVTGGTAGTATVTYSLGSGCIKTATVTVNTSPAVITGTPVLCVGMTTTLSETTTGGSWSSSNTSVATVSSGVVTGVGGGTAIISYSMPTGCSRWVIVTVNTLPAAAANVSVCQGQTTTLTTATPGGAWSSSDPTVATITTPGGVVTGVTAGTVIITYSLGTGCISTSVVTVLPLPAAITGALNLCPGTVTTLADVTTGGSWSSSNAAVAAIGSSTGIVTGGSVSVATTATITYTLASTGCYQIATVTVNPLPAAITGSTGFCNLTTTTLSDATAGGTWSSGTPATADFPSATSGALTAANVGTVTVTYTLPTGCIATRDETIILAPYPITGTFALCEGVCTTMSNIITGGTWTSTDPTVAPISTPGGVACGISSGTTAISYELSNGCYSSVIETVNATPGAITGTPEVCVGLTTTLANALSGGSWSSTDASIAFADPITGVVTGENPGTAIISYTMAGGCYASVIVTVDPLPSPVTGTLEVCVGLTSTLSNSTAGGTWSSDPSLWYIASVTPGSGVVSGINPGTTTITYTLPTGCIALAEVTVNPLPSAITGTFAICTGSGTVLDNIAAGGTWSSSDVTVATIDGTGTVSGIDSGVVTITYTLPTGCIAMQELTVNPVPTIGGSLSVCAGFMSNLTATLPGGIWSMTGSLSVANIYPLTGVIVGITPGTVTVSYTLGTGCYTTAEVTINPLPAPISGTASVCVSSSTTLSDSNPGGTWISSDPTIATIDPSGVVSGIAAGNTAITYTIGTGCINVRTVTVNPLPAALTGDSLVCEHFSTTLHTTSTGGAWSSSNTAVGTVGLYTGVVTGMVAGTANISYTIVATGCARSRTVTVNPTPTPIATTPYICVGSTKTLTDAYAGGTWISTVPLVATIGSSSGIATGLSLGTTTISYTMPITGCYTTQNVTVSPLPNVYNVTGGGSYCSGGAGMPVNLSGSQPGVSYAVYYGSSATGYATGTGAPITFGLMTVAGIYTVQATDALSGCKRNMSGSDTIVVTLPATPIVSVTTATGDTVCPGGPRMFTAVPGAGTGGSLPTYTWKVNGVPVSSGLSTYSFIPASGDVVQVTMTSNAACVSPATAVGVMTVTVLPSGMPAVSMSIDPGDTVCMFSMTNYTATGTFGGPGAIYKWLVNGSVVDSGATFSYVPTNGDAVQVQLTSNYLCRLANTAMSSTVMMAVDSIRTPHVTIVPSPGLMIHTGEALTLNTTVTNAGAHPLYQWKVNGIPVPGATSASYTSTFNQYDSVTCLVTSTGVCADITTFDWVFITVYPLGVNVNQMGLGNDLMLVPNPNRGAFTIRGTLGSASNEDLSVEVTDMLGQVVYTGKFTARNGKVDERIELSKTLANGMYMLNLISLTDRKVFHFVMEQ